MSVNSINTYLQNVPFLAQLLANICSIVEYILLWDNPCFGFLFGMIVHIFLFLTLCLNHWNSWKCTKDLETETKLKFMQKRFIGKLVVCSFVSIKTMKNAFKIRGNTIYELYIFHSHLRKLVIYLCSKNHSNNSYKPLSLVRTPIVFDAKHVFKYSCQFSVGNIYYGTLNEQSIAIASNLIARNLISNHKTNENKVGTWMHRQN